MTRSAWVAILLVLAVAGGACGRGDEKGSEPVGAPSSTAATTPITTTTTAPVPTTVTVGPTTSTGAPQKLSADSRVRIDGIGQVQIGMTLDEVRQAAGVPLTLHEGPFCRELRPDGPPTGLAFVFRRRSEAKGTRSGLAYLAC